jgi:hypothetical protein
MPKYFLNDETIEILMDLREKEGKTWENIANEIGIDPTIFSKLKNQGRELNKEYEIKITRFLTNKSILPNSGIGFEVDDKNPASMKIENGTYNNSNISMFTKEQKTGYVSDVQSKLIGELTTENTLLKQKIKDLEAELLRAKGNA